MLLIKFVIVKNEIKQKLKLNIINFHRLSKDICSECLIILLTATMRKVIEQISIEFDANNANYAICILSVVSVNLIIF